MSKDEVLYVPNPGMNYYPKGSPETLEGAVPNHPVDDQYLLGIRANLYAQGLSDGGPDVKLPEVEPNSQPLPEESAAEPVPVLFENSSPTTAQ